MNPTRLKALQTETEKLVVEYATIRACFPSTRARTQQAFVTMIDTFLTVHGFDDRLAAIREVTP